MRYPLTVNLPTRLALAAVQMLAAFLMVAVLVVALSAPSFAGGRGHNPVTICHNGHTITVDDDAVKAHVKHGDTIGACAEPTPTVTPTEEPSPWPTDTPTEEPTSEPSPTSSPTPTGEPSPSDEPAPTSTPSPTPTPTTASPSPSASSTPAASPVAADPSASATASSSSSSTPADPSHVAAEVHTVATLAETGTGTRDGLIVAGFVLTAGVLLLVLAQRRRPR